MSNASPFPADFFRRYDERPDYLYYLTPRLVTHIDDEAIAALGALFGELLPPDGHFLDLMSSWRTHLPPQLAGARVTGLGLNAIEMVENPQVDAHVIHSLNDEPELPFADATFDAALCTVSVQYLTQPLAVFQAVRRVLKPGGVFVVSFSNRCFPDKAIAGWLQTDDAQHIALVAGYFVLSGGWGQVHTRLKNTAHSDPLYMVWAHKSADAP